MNNEPDLKRSRRNGDRGKAIQDRLPPHNVEAEQGVLGCIIMDSDAAIPECGGLTAISMYDLRHRTILDHLLRMHDERTPIDVLTICEHLKTENKLESAGGISYVAELPDKVHSAAHVSAYAEIVSKKARLRQIIQSASAIVGAAYEASEEDVEDVIDEAEQSIMRLGDITAVGGSESIGALVGRAMDTIEHYHQNQGLLSGISTGFTDLDKLTCGLHNGDMIVIAGRPSLGKTSLAIQIAEHVAVEERLPVGIFSLEMTADSLAMRMLCSRARVNIRSVREGFLAERDIPRLTGAAAVISGAPVHIDDSSALSIFQLRTKARRMSAQLGIKLLVIDYLQLLHSSSRKVDNRQQEIADISCGIKAIAKELRIPVIAISQLNREVERDGKRRPRLSDLRESGAIEQDSDLVGILYKPTPDDDDDETTAKDYDVGPVNLYIAKQRNGPAQVDVALTFLRGYTRFESAAKVAPETELPYKDL